MAHANAQLRRAVAALLAELPERVPPEDRPLTPAGILDVKAFNELPEVLNLKAEIEDASTALLGENVINAAWLSENGFKAEALMLQF